MKSTVHQKFVRFFGTIAIVLYCCFGMAAGKEKMEDVAGRLSCWCGTCPHLVVTECGCSTADQIKAEITKRLAAGETGDQIVQSYVAKYGQTALAAPPKSGFNLTAWLIPFVAFGIGGTVLVVYMIKQKRMAPEPVETKPNPPDEKDSHYLKMLEKELRQVK